MVTILESMVCDKRLADSGVSHMREGFRGLMTGWKDTAKSHHVLPRLRMRYKVITGSLGPGSGSHRGKHVLLGRQEEP